MHYFYNGVRNSLFLALVLVTAVPVFAQSGPEERSASPNEPFAPNIQPSLDIPRTEDDVHIDGRLDEAFWQNAAVATNFSENFPDELARPPIDMKTLVAYDEKNLYVAYVINDDPAQIRSNFSDRDRIWQDDYAGMLLDTNGDGQRVYFIAANPLGIQGDTFSSNGREDVSFDLIFSSAGQVTATGYQVEMAIPFRSLRFPKADVQNWRATFWITHPRDSRNTYSWAGINQNDPCMSCQFGLLGGMRGVQSGKNLEILPTLTGSQSGRLADFNDPKGAFLNDRAAVDPSLNIKYGITSDLTADLTLNPDFSQIEADAARIDVNSTFALFFPERRTFFQEGSDMFRTELQTVYTRSINDPIVANKLTGRFGNTSVAYIGARDNESPLLLPFEESSRLVSGGKSVSNILRVRQSFTNNSFIGGLVTDRRLDAGGSGSTFAIDGLVRFLTNYSVSFQAVASHTAEPDDEALSADFSNITFDGDRRTAAFDGENFWGSALTTSVGRSGRHYNFDFTYRQLSPTFRADNGFITQNNNRRLMSFHGYTFYPSISFIDRITPRIFGWRTWNFDGQRKNESISPAVNIQFKRQTNVNIQFRFARELFNGRDFGGLNSFRLGVFSNFSEKIQFNLNANFGKSIARNVEDPFIGDSQDLSVGATLRPTSRLVLQPQINYSELKNPTTGDDVFSGYIARTRFNYQFTGALLARVIVQFNDFSQSLEVDPLVTYRVNPFTVAHFGSSHRYDTLSDPTGNGGTVFAQSDRQIFFKLQYLFRQ